MNKHENTPSLDRAANDWGSLSHVQTLVLMLITAVGIYLCYQLALPFLTAFAWALALAVLFCPVHHKLESMTKRPSLAAAISVLIVGIIVVVPSTFVGQRLVQEAVKGAELIKTKVESGEWRHAIESHPRLVPLADWMDRQNLTETASTVAAWMTTTGASFVKGSLVELIGLFLTFYLLFFLLRDHHMALQLLRSLLPLSDADMDRLFVRVGDTIYATIYGTLVVSAVQGILGGLMFWWLGLPAPLLWGVVMGLMAVLPVLGPFVVWVPAALFLALEGSWGKALILTIWGAAVIGTIGNFLHPFLVGNRMKLHTILTFISVVGGLILFGPSGLILGPVSLTITKVLLDIWRSRTQPKAVDPAASEDFSRFETDGGPGAIEPAMSSTLHSASTEFPLEGALTKKVSCTSQPINGNLEL